LSLIFTFIFAFAFAMPHSPSCILIFAVSSSVCQPGRNSFPASPVTGCP